ncbi:MAG: DUF5658 family protein [Firmicutes bacterium]|nr:DUF5658 family protein [Bacillota bacterium]
MAIIIWLLGFVDVYLTKHGLYIGAITEGNPIMAQLFNVNPNVAVIFSLGLSAFFLYCLHHLRTRSLLAQRAMWGLLFLRMFIIGLHLHWLFHFYI